MLMHWICWLFGHRYGVHPTAPAGSVFCVRCGKTRNLY